MSHYNSEASFFINRMGDPRIALKRNAPVYPHPSDFVGGQQTLLYNFIETLTSNHINYNQHKRGISPR